MTVDDFEVQPRGPYLFNFWQARTRVPTPFGEFAIEAHMPLEDTGPPDARMLRQAEKLSEFALANSDAILDRIFTHYRALADQSDWLAACGVPSDLQRDELAPYLDELTLVVSRERSEPTIYIIPRWDHEHAIYLNVRRGRLVSEDF
jgi:hypothetical protein